MIQATVIGSIWMTKCVDGLPKGALLEVESDDGAKFVAVDVLQSAVGERVLIATGSGAAAWLGMDRMPPIDALIIGSIDDDGKEAS